MKLIVDVSKELYNNARDYETPLPSNLAYAMRTPIANGTPLTDLTNGEVVMKLFPNEFVCKEYNNVFCGLNTFCKDWWNAKWEGNEEISMS